MATHSSIFAWTISCTEDACWWAVVQRVTKSRTQLKQLSMPINQLYWYTATFITCLHIVCFYIAKLLTNLMESPKLSKLENIDYLSLYRKSVSDPEKLHQISYIKMPGLGNTVIFQILRISLYDIIIFQYQFSSIAQSCPTLCDPVDCSMPGFPVHHQLQKIQSYKLDILFTYFSMLKHQHGKFTYKLYSSLQS